MTHETIRVLPERCVGCGLCAKACPFGAIRIADGLAAIDAASCTLCGACVSACSRFNAIELVVAAPPVHHAPVGDLWVFCEPEGRDGSLTPVSRELLGLGCTLAAQIGVRTAAVLLGHQLQPCIAEAAAYGAETVYVADDPRLAHFDDQDQAGILARLVQAGTPEILLGGATAVGRALLPRVAVLLHTGLTADCTELSIDPETGLLHQTRPAFGGNILATITCANHRPQMATVRPGVLPPPQPLPQAPRARLLPIPLDDVDFASSMQWLGFAPRLGGGIDLREAEVIVTAGYGAGGPDGVRLVASLARALGASLGSSRPVVDAGWIDYAHQVGQTGTTVQPRLYIACGVSGAIQHVVGMQNSDTVVAINRDPEAPIFAYADYAVVGDIFEIIPRLLQRLHGSGS